MKLPKSVSLYAALVSCVLVSPALAEWPERPVTLVVPFTAGGTADVLARLMARHLQAEFDMPFVVENRPGAEGSIGVNSVANAEPDGYTLVSGTISTHATGPILNDLPYNVQTDFVPVSHLFAIPNILFVRSGLGVETTQELIDYLNENPGELFFGSTGLGSSQYIAGELFQVSTDTTMDHVPYGGAGDIMIALLGGHLDIAFNSASASVSFLDSEDVRALGISSPTPMETFPNVPTLAETIPGFETGSWMGIWAPAGTPDEIVTALSEKIEEILAWPEVIQEAQRLGAQIQIMSGDEFGQFVDAEQERWASILLESAKESD